MDLIDFTHRQWTQFAHFVDSDGRHVEITSNAVKAGLVDFAKQVSYGVAHLRNLGRQMSSGADDICVTCGRSRSGCQTCLFRQCPVCMKVGRCQLRHRQHFCFACFGLRSLLCKRTPCLNCHDFVLEQRYFHSRTLAYLETGIYCKMPSASSKFDRVWIYFNIERGELLWRSFQLQNNLPLHQGSILMSRINRITREFPYSL
ncbi:MAG: hypothetical protein KVP17_002094 [Porospora cf. gigantea B]|uniref:uncharacterized protein n=1 Tax=Porospora cf. gigantea B TaxID=2853592 RepID=UPI003571F20A|nr:MAG: hypothetical protein KVP17_002094 [Porospora cf. gigantea B]